MTLRRLTIGANLVHQLCKRQNVSLRSYSAFFSAYSESYITANFYFFGSSDIPPCPSKSPRLALMLTFAHKMRQIFSIAVPARQLFYLTPLACLNTFSFHFELSLRVYSNQIDTDTQRINRLQLYSATTILS